MERFEWFGRRLFAAVGLLGVVMQLLRPVWRVNFTGGQISHIHSWFWSGPDLHLDPPLSCAIDLASTLGPAGGMATCTWIWWWATGRAERARLAL